jgi:hypothetical protein
VIGLGPYGAPSRIGEMRRIVHLSASPGIAYRWTAESLEFATSSSLALEELLRARHPISCSPPPPAMLPSAPHLRSGTRSAAARASYIMDPGSHRFAVFLAAQLPGSPRRPAVEEIPNEVELCRRTAAAIADGKVDGWYQPQGVGLAHARQPLHRLRSTACRHQGNHRALLTWGI